jgi:hypothetical protein
VPIGRSWNGEVLALTGCRGKRREPRGRRRFERDLDRVVGDCIHGGNRLVVAQGGGARRRITEELESERNVGRCERLTVVPLHALLEFPGNAGEIFGNSAVFHARDFGGENWHQLRIGIEVGQRLGVHAYRAHILCRQ